MSDGLRIVTIDGPSGAGKSTVAKIVAQKLSFIYLDTGAMYRAVAWQVLEMGLELTEQEKIGRVVADIDISFLPATGDDVLVLVNGKELGLELRTPQMGMAASKVSALTVVRTRMTELQQQMGQKGGLVAEGRDTGTVVFPTARWKFYLDAEAEERARRRVNQLSEQGLVADYTEILQQIKERDRNDTERAIAPLKKAEDAILIDATNLDIDGVVADMMSCISK